MEPALEALLARIAARDKSAFTDFFRATAGRVKGLLLRQGADAALADEVLQEVMLTVWRKAGTFDPARASARTWLFTIARNRLIDRQRRMPRAQVDPTDPTYTPDLAAGIDRARAGARMREALGALPDDQAAILERVYTQGQTLAEVADATGVPLGTVKSRVRLAMDKLRQAFEEDG